MLKFYEKHSWRAVVKSWGFVLVLLFIVIFLAYIVYGRYTIEQEMVERRREAEHRLQLLEERKQTIKDKVEYLGSDRGIEAEMRRNFDVAQPGEQVVIIVDDKNTTTTEIKPLTPAATSTPWYIFWR